MSIEQYDIIVLMMASIIASIAIALTLSIIINFKLTNHGIPKKEHPKIKEIKTSKLPQRIQKTVYP